MVRYKSMGTQTLNNPERNTESLAGAFFANNVMEWFAKLDKCLEGNIDY